MIPDAKDKATKDAAGLVLCFTKSRPCGEVDVKELGGRVVLLSSESGDLETSTSKVGPAKTLWILVARLDNEFLFSRE